MINASTGSSESAKYFRNLLHTQNPIRVLCFHPPHPFQVCDLFSFSLLKQTIVFANRQHLCDKMKLWLDSEWNVSAYAAPKEPWTWNLNNIYSQRSLSCYSKHAHCWKMRWAGRFQDDPGLIDSGPIVCGRCLLGLLQFLQFPPTVQEPDH